jgi:hypothetical protein
MDNAYLSVSGSTLGRQYAIRQINQAYVMLLCSHFQGFCRDLHDECIDWFEQGLAPVPRQAALHTLLIDNRKLAPGNPNPGNIGADFNRFGVEFWNKVINLDARNESRRRRLDELNLWRNAIAHQDYTSLSAGSVLRHQDVRLWRKARDRLAVSFDEVMRSFLASIIGASPW